jgi:hypothetical protein
MFQGLYLIESQKLGGACFSDGRERSVGHLGTHLVQVCVQVELWQHYQIP